MHLYTCVSDTLKWSIRHLNHSCFPLRSHCCHRPWPVPAAGCQVVQCTCHVFRRFNSGSAVAFTQCIFLLCVLSLEILIVTKIGFTTKERLLHQFILKKYDLYMVQSLPLPYPWAATELNNTSRKNRNCCYITQMVCSVYVISSCIPLWTVRSDSGSWR